MPEFLNLIPPPEALERFLTHLDLSPTVETVPVRQALGRVLAEDLRAAVPLPEFARSTVDGFAVRARDTFGAGDALPAYLKLKGEVLMGTLPGFELSAAECALIHTGGMVPPGADAVVMVESTGETPLGEVEIYRPAAPGENVIQVGEDVREGEVVLKRGVRIRPAEIGGLMALGLTDVPVARGPKVAILSSGDEVVPPETAPALGQVRDVNSYALEALVRAAGGDPVLSGILPDRIEAFREAAEQALAACDLVVFTAGSSVSVRDLTAEVIAGLGEPGVLVHGVSVRPGKPTILAVCGGKPVVGLPGNPVSALVIARLFVVPVIERYLGVLRPQAEASVVARLAANLPSQAGREDWVPVRLSPDADSYRAEPVFGRSNLIFSLARADGLVRIPAAANGLPAGAAVTVYLL
jgi:molybdopterin molybdotransferase